MLPATLIAPVQWCETILRVSDEVNYAKEYIISNRHIPCTRENIFSMLLWVARVTFNFSDISVNFSPWITKSKTLYIRLWSHRPSLRSRPEKIAFSLTFPSVMMYSRHGGGVKIYGDLGTREAEGSLLTCPPQSEDWRSRKVRKTLETVNAKTLTIEKLRSRHGGDCWERHKLCTVRIRKIENPICCLAQRRKNLSDSKLFLFLFINN